MIEIIPNQAYIDYDVFRTELKEKLLEEITPFLGQNFLTIQDKKIPFPRLTAWFGDESATYNYSGIYNVPNPWTPILQTIKDYCCARFYRFPLNSCLVNYYRDGNDSIGFHQDNEEELSGGIVSVSFGATRTFWLKKEKSAESKRTIIKTPLLDGSLLLMKVPQNGWQHSIPKEPDVTGDRLNLTFRVVPGAGPA